MEAFVLLVVLYLVIVPAAAAISAARAHARAKAAEERIKRQDTRIERLQSRLDSLEHASVRTTPVEPPARIPSPIPAPRPEEPPPLPEGAAGKLELHPPLRINPSPWSPAWRKPPREHRERESAAEPPPPPAATAPGTPVPATAAAPGTPTSPTTEAPGMPAPATTARALSFNVEALLGVRGAAWGGAIALAIAGILFTKYAFEHNLITPAARVALMIAAGLAAIGGAEAVLRRGFEITANALSAAGVLLLYTGFYVGHAFYDLLPLAPTFGLMSAVTLIAGFIAIRHRAIVVAILGLLGGFTTPILLTTGENRPVLLFSYVLLLDAGLLSIAARRSWTLLAPLSLAGTILLQILWFAAYVSPDQSLVAAAILGVFPMVYLAFPSVARAKGDAILLATAAASGTAPFAFLVALAAGPGYAGRWPILFGLALVLSVALALASRRRGQSFLAAVAVAGVVLTESVWLPNYVTPARLPIGAALLGSCALLWLAAPTLLRRAEDKVLLACAAAAGAAPFAHLVWLASIREHGDRFAVLFGLALVLSVALALASRRRGQSFLAVAGVVGVLFTEVAWFDRFMVPEYAVTGMAILGVFALLHLSFPTLLRRPEDPVLLGASVAAGLAPFPFLFWFAGSPGYAADWPFTFALAGVLDAAFVAAALRRKQAYLLPAGAAATAITTAAFAAHGLSASNLWVVSMPVLLAAAFFSSLPWLRRPLAAPKADASDRDRFEAGALVSGAGTALFAAILAGRGFAEPPWLFGLFLALLLAVTVARGLRVPGDRVTPFIGILAVAVLAQVGFFAATTPPTALRNLLFPAGVTVVVAIAARVRYRAASGPSLDAAAVGAAAVATIGLLDCVERELCLEPWPLAAALALSVAIAMVTAARRDQGWLALPAVALSASLATAWVDHWSPVRLPIEALLSFAPVCVGFVALPFLLPRRPDPARPPHPGPFIASALAGPLFLYALHEMFVAGAGGGRPGAPAVVLAVLAADAAWLARRTIPAPEGDAAATRRRLRVLALYAVSALFLVAVAIPIQYRRQWITIGLAVEAAFAWWLYRRLPHASVKYAGAVLFAVVAARLLANPEVLRYAPPGPPVFNFLLTTYGIAAIACFGGSALLHPVEAARLLPPEREFFGNGRWGLAPCAVGLGLALLFALVNLEIADWFSGGQPLRLRAGRDYARDLATSIGWGAYALGVLGFGMWRGSRLLRYVSLGAMMLTVGKVFLFDLAALTGLYRVLSFLGLAVALILVSLLYQRFVFRRPARHPD